MIYVVLFAAAIAGMLLSMYLANRDIHRIVERRRRNTERLIADLKSDEVALERKDPT